MPLDSPQLTVTVSDETNATERAAALLKDLPEDVILTCGLSEPELRHVFQQTDCVFTDADGTVVVEGMTVFPERYAAYVQQLADIGVSVTLLTGKPYEEIAKIVASLPKGSPLKIIYEKGAYFLEADEQGVMQKRYLLSTPELEASMAELRSIFLEEKQTIEATYRNPDGTPQVTLGWSGSGQHKSVLSIDILRGVPPENYIDIVGPEREALKVQDPGLLERVEADLLRFVETHRPGWRLIHLGNGNSEIAPGPIEKDIAVQQMREFQEAKGVLVWGDSGNDQKMFALRRLSKVHAGLVLHRERSLSLVQEVDFVAFGMANAKPFFELLLSAQRHE